MCHLMDILPLCHKFLYRCQTVVEGQGGGGGGFRPMLITTGYTACSVTGVLIEIQLNPGMSNLELEKYFYLTNNSREQGFS